MSSDGGLLLSADDPRCAFESVVGGKAASLAALHSAGFDVPQFCAVSCGAFTELHATGSAERLRVPLVAWLAAHSADARFAVRSSARGEDSAENSFAGLYTTVLDVVGIDAVLKAITTCWASFDKTEARAYRQQRRSDASAMGVVVQRLVPAEWSGVAFSANPVTLALGEGMINATPGLGEALVKSRRREIGRAHV